MNIQKGDGIASLLSMAFNMIKPALPKIATTIGLSGLLTGVSHGINKILYVIFLVDGYWIDQYLWSFITT